MNYKQPRIVPGLDFPLEEVMWAREREKLLSMDIETGLACNLKCLPCYRYSSDDVGRKSPNEISFEKIREIIDEAIELGLRRACLIGGGEPLLHGKKYFKTIDYLNEMGVPHVTFTNGTLITAEVATELIKRQASLTVKMNSFDPTIHDRLTGVPGTHRRVMKAWENLFKAGYTETEFPILAFETVICKDNYHEIPKLWVWARDHEVVPYVELITPQGRALIHDLIVPSQQCKLLFEKLLSIDQEKYGYTWEPTPPIAGYHCCRHYMSVTLDAEGFVKPCVGVDIYIGNVKYNKLGEIIQQSKVLKLLRNINNNIKGPCKTCQYHEICYGCRGAAYHVLGDFLASDPRCWFNHQKVM